MSPWSDSPTESDSHSKLLEEFREAKSKAEAANEAKSAYLARISHELRTPLSAIVELADLVAEEALSEEERRAAAEALRTRGGQLLRVLEEINESTQAETGRLTVERIPCRPRDIVDDVLKLMKPGSDERGLTLTVDFPPDVPETIESDPIRLRQILANLISNAIKFTARGGIRLIVRPVGENAPPERLQFDVIDTGIGLSESQQRRLFRTHSPAEESIHRRFGGIGLGLVIARELAELLGGSISCQSALGQGSTFSVTIATGLGSRAEVAEEAMPRLIPQVPSMLVSPGSLADEGGSVRPPRVLIAEDYADNRCLIVHLLKKSGALVDEAEHGKIAVEMALAAVEANAAYDLILMDMQMPEMDGYTATRSLRDQGYTGPIVALTAYSMKGDRENCLAAGCDDYLSKPLSPTEFWPVIARQLMGSAPPISL